MQFTEIGAFDVAHKHLAWPWIAVDPARTRFAFASAKGRLESRVPFGDALRDGPSFPLPKDLVLPTKARAPTGHLGSEKGIHGFAIATSGDRAALTGIVKKKSVVVTLGEKGETKRTEIESLWGEDFIAHAITFDRSGKRLWISAESGKETALILIDAETHVFIGAVKSAPFPPPAAHELHVHPQDDAVLLLAACGQDGTFARVAGFTDGPPIAIATALDLGSVSGGFVGFSADSARVHIAEADELRTHAWPGLQELSSVELADDFASSYSGVVMGERVYVDGEDMDTGDVDAVMLFDRSATRGAVLAPPVPTGMWVGRIGPDALITVEAKGEPVRGRVLKLPAPSN